ncbi:uncharacterized protein LOC142230920 [Haematobia irritans]|uniref:uncharacterized protein LOC142230920 n=1 Tax=Haematobia irritans TaxID=7368 RepID=UPI003F4FB954
MFWVWDAAAKSNGAFLNGYMHSGPDLLKPLVNVLLNFRVEVWRSDINWDDEIHNCLYIKWHNWKAAIDLISAFEIPRCYSQYLNEATQIELHTLVDAGEDVYTAVCYIRIVTQHLCDVAIIASKSKVAPLKPMYIPRLDLQPAIIGVRIAEKVLEISRLNVTSKYFCKDSETVLQWLRMDPKKFQQFVCTV